MKGFAAAFFILLTLCGCAAQQQPAAQIPTAQPVGTTEAPTVPISIEQEAVALAEAPPPPVSVVLEAEPSGLLQSQCPEAVIDYSHTEQGYVMARYGAQTDKRLKIRISGPTTTYTYNLPVDRWTVFPLSDGNGSYHMTLYINTHDTKYAAVLTASFAVTLDDEFAPFLRPNQYVDYTDAVCTVEKGAVLCAGLEKPLEKVEAVYDYVVSTLVYDHEKAAQVQSGYLPVLDQVLEEKKGICFDYAALMTAMLRSQQVPCKLVVGYAGQIYHAWISVWTEEEGWIDGVIFFDGNVWKRMDPTFASSGERSEDIMDYIENGSYTVKYLY